MWRTGLLYLDRGDSAIISALRDAGYNTQQTPGSPNRRFSVASSTDTEIIWERRVKSEIPSPHQTHQNIQQWISPPDGTSIKFSRPRTTLQDMDPLSPTTDATLFEEPQLHSLNFIKEDEPSPDYFSYQEGLERSPSIKSASTVVTGEEPAANQTRRIRHHRAASIVSTLSNGPKTPTTPRSLPIRAQTTDGLLKLQSGDRLLKLQADATKPSIQRSQTTRLPHQRRISLGLPIKAPDAAPSERPQRERPHRERPQQTSPTAADCETPSRPSHPPRYSQIMGGSTSSPSKKLIQQERELEYKHRHTFIGTASLDDFLEVLDVSPAKTTTKAAVVRAFLLLASSERLLARQASTTPSGWGLVARTTSDTVNADYVEQAHAKLGSIVLRQFLDLIPFDEDEVAGAISVVEAFTAASHLDAKGSGNGSKAKAFRSWLVRAQSD